MPLFDVRYFNDSEQIGDMVTIDRDDRAAAIHRAILFANELSRRANRAVVYYGGEIIEELSLE